ncbi:hypothetical protein PQR71_33745 [Paraburkholderia fungorum]|uniref:hypothetical protein n=1 Tax=Paraburkholderia fungorum TaxID=134537 RepID=UPI0038B6DDF6
MSNRLNADELLREAFEALNPFLGGGIGDANRKAELCEKIARYLAGQGKPVARGGGGGGPADFRGGVMVTYAAPGSTSTGLFAVKPGDAATIRIGEGGGASFQIDEEKK